MDSNTCGDVAISDNGDKDIKPWFTSWCSEIKTDIVAYIRKKYLRDTGVLLKDLKNSCS